MIKLVIVSDLGKLEFFEAYNWKDWHMFKKVFILLLRLKVKDRKKKLHELKCHLK